MKTTATIASAITAIILITIIFLITIKTEPQQDTQTTLCQKTGGTWTECGSGCGPLTRQQEENEINISYRTHKMYFGDYEGVDKTIREYYEKYPMTEKEYIFLIGGGPLPIRKLTYEEFKEEYFKGTFRPEVLLCPAVCIPQCECPQEKKYWDGTKGCVK